MKHHNQNLNQSLAVLSHPLTISVFLLYLANTFFLQRVFPSWWTGKISDFAWLFFFPFVLCVPLSFLIPRKHFDQRGKVIYLAIALCGIPFALLKSSPYLLALTSQAFKGWSGMSLDLAGDPSDLIALASLLGAVLFWNCYRTAGPISGKLSYVLVVLSIAFTLADSAMPDRGIYYLESREDYLFACSTYGRYQSTDGGMNWNLIEYADNPECKTEDHSQIVFDAFNRTVQYRYDEVGKIYRSENAGHTWTMDYNWKPRSYASEIYVRMKNQTNYFSNYPLNAVYDPHSGNIVFAMGSEGILVRQPGGQYAWRDVDHYKKIEVEPLTVLRELIWGEVYLGFLLGCLLVSLSVLKLNPFRFRKFLTYFLLFAWMLVAVVFPPAPMSTSNYNMIPPALGMIGISFFTLPLFIESLILAGKHQKRFLLRILLLFCAIILTFPFPYALWALGLYDSYFAAFLFALFMEIVIAILFFRKLQDEFPAALDTAQANTDKP